jgi:hypothetical protein
MVQFEKDSYQRMPSGRPTQREVVGMTEQAAENPGKCAEAWKSGASTPRKALRISAGFSPGQSHSVPVKRKPRSELKLHTTIDREPGLLVVVKAQASAKTIGKRIPQLGDLLPGSDGLADGGGIVAV